MCCKHGLPELNASLPFIVDQLEIRKGVLQTLAAGTQCLTAFITNRLELRKGAPHTCAAATGSRQSTPESLHRCPAGNSNSCVLQTRAAGAPCSRVFTADQLENGNVGVLQPRAAGAPCPRAFTADRLEALKVDALQPRAACPQSKPYEEREAHLGLAA